MQYIPVQIKIIKKLSKKGGDVEQADVRLLASTEAVDRDGEVIMQSGWDLTHFLKNPVILWAHDYTSLPIGKALRVEKTSKGLEIDIKFASEKANPKAQQVKTLIDEGIQNAGSVGFIPTKRNEQDESIIEEAQLLEFSLVPVPANPEALALAAAKGISKTMFTTRGVVAKHEPPQADKGLDFDTVAATNKLREWAGGPDSENIDFAKYATGFGWFDSDNEKSIESYKLVHHDIVDGEFNVVWRGVVAAMQVLLGAREGVEIPAADKQGVYDHLAKHYEQFGEEVPEFKAYNKMELRLLDKGGHKPKPKPRKDVAETVALADVIGHLDFLTFAFEQNDIKSEVVAKMREALQLLMDILVMETTIGSKQFNKQEELPPECDIDDPAYDPDKCAELTAQAGKQEATKVQTLILSKDNFATLDEASTWITEHDFSADKVDETETSFRFRQFSPGECQEESFRTIDFEGAEGVQAVICRPIKGKLCGIKIIVERYNINDNIDHLAARVGEQLKGQNPLGGKRAKSKNKVGVTVELPIELVQDLRERTLKAYKQNEQVLAVTKQVQQVLHKLYEQKSKTDKKGV